MVADENSPAGRAVRAWDTVAERPELLSPPRDGAFAAIAELAANRCGTAMAIVNLTDAEGFWSEAGGGSPRQPVSTSVFVRPGTTPRHAEPGLLADPETAMENSVPFYAAVPIAAGEGRKLGMLAVLDESVRDIDAPTIADLKLLARLVTESLELRLTAKAELEARG
ncbi:MAG: GAF domain-containing protein [Sphingomonas sp.]|uniref:hypothetical protein n=1 Tax=Sphingomonas sp. TaxID=28214 RepID=UPI001B237E0E|nr:hypothetical protein [Sphingomonas sp.]MBO9623051.1 GAF domain-containing protein [Sphingomonas sp.]